MKNITFTLTENEAKALVNWVSWTREEREQHAAHYEKNCKMGCYVDNSKPRAVYDEISLTLNVVNILKNKLS
jgi:hypothetical protein